MELFRPAYGAPRLGGAAPAAEDDAYGYNDCCNDAPA